MDLCRRRGHLVMTWRSFTPSRARGCPRALLWCAVAESRWCANPLWMCQAAASSAHPSAGMPGALSPAAVVSVSTVSSLCVSMRHVSCCCGACFAVVCETGR
jgi:hypothetical protein